MDVAVSGPKFGASSVPTLKQFLREVTKVVPGPKGGMLYDDWRKSSQSGPDADRKPTQDIGGTERTPAAQSSSTFPSATWAVDRTTPYSFSTWACPPSDVGSSGSYGVYHSVFDNFNWFKKFGDPDFIYEQEMARVFGVETFAWQTPTCCPTTTRNMARKSASILIRRKGKQTLPLATNRPILPRPFAPRISSSRREQRCCASNRIRATI